MKNNKALYISLILICLVGCGNKESSTSTINNSSNTISSSTVTNSSTVISSSTITSSSTVTSNIENPYDSNFTNILKEEKEVRTYPNELSFDLDNTYKADVIGNLECQVWQGNKRIQLIADEIQFDEKVEQWYNFA